MSVAKRVSEDRARFGSHRAHSAGSFAPALDETPLDGTDNVAVSQPKQSATDRGFRRAARGY